MDCKKFVYKNSFDLKNLAGLFCRRRFPRNDAKNPYVSAIGCCKNKSIK